MTKKAKKIILTPGEHPRQYANEEFFQFAEAIPQILYMKDQDDRMTFYNKRWYEYTGFAYEENPGSGKVMHPHDYAKYLKVWEKCRLAGKIFEMEFRLRRKDGQYRWFLGRAVSIKDKKGKIIKWFGTATDIHDHKENEQILFQREKYFRALIENSSDIIFLIRNQQDITYVSPSVKKLLGFSNLFMEKKDFFDFVYPDDHAIAEKSLENKKNQGLSISQFRLKRKDGTWRWIECVIHNLEKDSSVGGVVVNARDITDRMELEKRKDDFISMASHELKTPVTSLKLYTEILESEAKEAHNTGAVSHLKKMSQQIDTLTSLINELLDLSRIQAQKYVIKESPFDICYLVKEVVHSIQIISSKHKIKLGGEKGITILGDKEKLRQVLVNLLMNAIKYSPDSEDVNVNISSDKENVKVSVRDFGIGIRPEQQKKVFDRFYQVQESHEKPFSGLGVGLYISKNIIVQHGGELWVESEYKKGSTFFFTLPIKGGRPNNEMDQENIKDGESVLFEKDAQKNIPVW